VITFWYPVSARLPELAGAYFPLLSQLLSQMFTLVTKDWKLFTRPTCKHSNAL